MVRFGPVEHSRLSYYLAVLNSVDPMPVPVIENLKKELEKI